MTTSHTAEFPGNHGGFKGQAQEFAEVLKRVLLADEPELGLSTQVAAR